MSPKVSRDDMKLRTGLMDDFDGTISRQTYFGDPKEEYAGISGSSDPVLHLIVDVPGLEEPIEQTYSLGAKQGWEVQRDGAEVTSALNPDIHSFNNRSRAGQLVDHMAKALGAGDGDVGIDVLLQRDRYMTEAEFYWDYALHFKQVPLPTAQKGETRDVLMPVALAAVAPTPAARAPAAKAAAPKAAVGYTLTDDETVRIVELAMGKSEAQLKSALLKEFSGNTALKTEIFNKGLLARLVKDGTLTVADGKFV